MPVDDLALAYVQLTLNINEHHDGYVDAFYGPKEWLSNIQKWPLEVLAQEADTLHQKVTGLEQSRHSLDPKTKCRIHSLKCHLLAVKTFIAQLQGAHPEF